MNPPPAARPRRPRWAAPVLVFGVVAILLAGVVGLRGLTADPIRGTDANGTLVEGSFEPFPCPQATARCVQGYVQAGARGVFVRFPDGCPAPAREQHVRVHAQLARDLGKRAYRSVECASS